MIEDTTTPFDSIDRRKFLRAGVGVAGATAALPILTGNVAAHFPAKLTIDIKPKSEKNRIMLGSGGTVTVAVVQTDGFDPTSKPVHYRFGTPDVVASGGGARPAESAQLKDVNGDGRMDLVLEFPLAETGFDGDEKKGKLIWERDHKGSEHGLSGAGPVTVIGGEQPAATANTTTGHEHGEEPTATTNATTGGAHGGHEHGGHEHGEEPTATMNATTAPTANTATGTAAKPATTTGKSTAATGGSNTATGESDTTTKTTTTTAQGPGFGALAAFGSVASIGAYLFARNSDNE